MSALGPGSRSLVRTSVAVAAAAAALVAPTGDVRAGLDFWATMSLAAGDFDGDAHADLAFVQVHLHGGPPEGRVMLLLRDPSGRLDFRRARAAPVGADPFEVVAADLDGDGRDDLVIADEGGRTVSIVLTRAGPNLDVTRRTIGSHPRALAAADLDGDGLLDVAASCDEGTFAIYADAPGAFGAPVRLGQSADWLAAGRVDGDLAADVVLVPSSRNATASFVVLYSDPSARGVVRERVETGDAKGRGPVAIADLDGDGDADVLRAASRRDAGRGEIWLSDGAAPPAFTLAGTFGVRGLPVWAAARDFDGDGDADLAVATSRTMNLVLRSDEAPFAFDRRSTRRWLERPLNCATADLDDDGLADFAAAGRGITVVRQFREKPGRLRPPTTARPHR